MRRLHIELSGPPPAEALGLITVASLSACGFALGELVWGAAASAGLSVAGCVWAWRACRSIPARRDVSAPAGPGEAEIFEDPTTISHADASNELSGGVSVTNEGQVVDWRVAQRDAALVEMGQELEAKVLGLLQKVDFSADTVEGSALETSDMTAVAQERADEIATKALAASNHMRELAASTEEMTNTITEITRLSAGSSQIAQAAVREIHDTADVVSGLSEAVRNIGNVSGLIHKIANQTNLLALNATIEAARAGEAGKGFSVVADEVKILAGQTAHATEEISAQIQQVQRFTEVVVRTIQGMGDTIHHINDSVGGISEAVGLQEITTREISGYVHKTAEDSNHIAEAVRGVNRMIDQASGHSSKSLDASSMLRQTSGELSQEVMKFLQTLQATDSPSRRRYPRHEVRGLHARVTLIGASDRVEVCELSRTGCRMKHPTSLAGILSPGLSVVVEFDGYPALTATVIWINDVECGFAYEQVAAEALEELISLHRLDEVEADVDVELWA